MSTTSRNHHLQFIVDISQYRRGASAITRVMYIADIAMPPLSRFNASIFSCLEKVQPRFGEVRSEICLPNFMFAIRYTVNKCLYLAKLRNLICILLSNLNIAGFLSPIKGVDNLKCTYHATWCIPKIIGISNYTHHNIWDDIIYHSQTSTV